MCLCVHDACPRCVHDRPLLSVFSAWQARAVHTKKAAEVRALENKLDVLTQLETSDGERADVRSAKPVVTRAAPSDVAAAPMWQAHVHPQTGETFYHNKASGVSTYTLPAELHVTLS